MAKKFRDFDSLVAEKRKDSPVFKMFGNTYTLPPTVRYDAVLELQRLAKRDKDDTLSDESAFNVFELFIGADIMKELRSNVEFTVDIAAELVNWLLVEYGFVTENDPKEKAE